MEGGQGAVTRALFLRFSGKENQCTLNKKWPKWPTKPWHARRRPVHDGAESRSRTRFARFFAPRLVGSYRSCAMGYTAPREQRSGKRTSFVPERRSEPP